MPFICRAVWQGIAFLSCSYQIRVSLASSPLPQCVCAFPSLILRLPSLFPSSINVILFIPFCLVYNTCHFSAGIHSIQVILTVFFRIGNKTWSSCARKVTICYYLFSVFVFWTRPTVNTFMPPLLPNSVFAFCTCAVPAHWSLAGFKCVFTYLMILGKQNWSSVTPNAAVLSQEEFFLPEEELLNLCRVWNQTVPLQNCVTASLYLNSVVQMHWKLWKSSKSSGKAVKVLGLSRRPFQGLVPVPTRG